MLSSVLVVDDEKNIRRTLRMLLEGAELRVLEAESGEAALEIAADADLVILDVRLPGISGVEVLSALRARADTRSTPVVMVSGHASVAEAVQAIQLGATDFFEKPLDRDRVLITVHNALRARQLELELERLRENAEVRYAMIGESAIMRRLYGEIEKVAPTKARVLVTGESGTGKELIARAIHRLSTRPTASFVKVNCAAIPAELIESELFGYERGAFTGAQQRRKGVFELADGGTLFLDEIGDMSASAQAKVLRALQNGEITRVGSERTIAVDVRVVAATNKDLEQEVAEGRFREDLLFRLNVVPIRSPSLRERREDIPALAASFLREFCRDHGFRDKSFAPGVLDALAQRRWLGNVRELRNVVERMAILGGDSITLEDLPAPSARESQRLERDQPGGGPHSANAPRELDLPPLGPLDGRGQRPSLREYRDDAERRYIVATLDACDWNISKAAGELGVERTNLHKKMRAFGIRRDH